MKKIYLLFDDFGIKDMDMRRPDMGNPGLGGTEYMYLMFAYYFVQNYSNDKIVFIHYNHNILPENCESIIIKNRDEVFYYLNQSDVLIHASGKDELWYKNAARGVFSLIVWAECYLSFLEMKMIENCSAVKKVVFVSKQEYDNYIDECIIQKSTYIYNMVQYHDDVRNKKLEAVVTYMGSLTPEKGFHVLAKSWKKVVKAIPDAKLQVIGSGKLYSRYNKLGKYGLADECYEKKFMKYLTNDNGDILKSVKFCGIVGVEKNEILKKTMVGVVNPTAISETFCISAVEMELLGIPVVTKGKLGLCDTIKNKYTGLTFLFEKNIYKYIIKLLKDKTKNQRYGENAIQFARKNFQPEIIIKQWYELLQRLDTDEIYIKPNNYYFNDFKWLRVMNRRIRKTLGYNHTVSINQLIYYIKKFLKGMIR